VELVVGVEMVGVELPGGAEMAIGTAVADEVAIVIAEETTTEVSITYMWICSMVAYLMGYSFAICYGVGV
jgi:hypothetical protein